MAPDQPRGLEAPHAARTAPTDPLDAASGFLAGIVIGLAMWAIIIGVCLVIA